VFDLETTGLDAMTHHIIEIGAIRVHRDRSTHDTFQTFVLPGGRISAKITELTGITRAMLLKDGIALDRALADFQEFVGDLPLVAFNAQFDVGFLKAACAKSSIPQFANETCCALKMARRAWPDRASYKLVDLARDGKLDLSNTHRALGDCKRTMIIYSAAATLLGSHR